MTASTPSFPCRSSALTGLDLRGLDPAQTLPAALTTTLTLLPNLTHLRLGGALTCDETILTAVAHLTSLTYLHLTTGGLDAAEPAVLHHLSRLVNLRHLTMDGVSLYGNGLAFASQLTALTRLDLPVCGLTADGLAHLTPLTKLVQLDLTRTDVAHIAHLSALTALQRLNLGCSAMTGDGVEGVASLQRLTHLTLSGCALNDAALAQVRAVLCQCTSVEVSLQSECTALYNDCNLAATI